LEALEGGGRGEVDVVVLGGVVAKGVLEVVHDVCEGEDIGERGVGG
jgi:hypothetical protein